MHFTYMTTSLSVKLRIFLILSCVLTFFCQCKKFVDVDPPNSGLIRETVFSNETTANSAQLVIYAQMANQLSANIAWYAGLSSDEFDNFLTTDDTKQLYNNALVSTNGRVLEIWTNLYKYIYESNAVIEGVTKAPGLSYAVKQQIIGEAKFTRAFCHFYLANLYGDIPLVTTTDYRSNGVAYRSSKDQVIAEIISDLKDAQNLLNINYVGSDGITGSTERLRPTKWAATALLARVYLFVGDWVNAESESTKVINNTNLFDILKLNEVFGKNSKEAIWQVVYSSAVGTNTREAQTFIISTTPNPVAINSTLLNAFELGDNRKSNWIGTISSWSYPFKYKEKAATTASKEYSMVLRLAEQYLIRAESRAQQNNISGSQSDLNTIRIRAGLPATTATDKATLLLAIERERQVELFSEWGHRWLDIRRTGRINAIMPSVTQKKGGTWNTNWQLYPVPQSEINNNINLTQNQGYF